MSDRSELALQLTDAVAATQAAVQRAGDRAFRAYGLSHRAHAALNAVDGSGPDGARPKDVAAALGGSPPGRSRGCRHRASRGPCMCSRDSGAGSRSGRLASSGRCGVPMLNPDGAAIQAAARALRAATRVVVATGAGMSQDSGIPTFRDAGVGLWARYDPEELATEAAFRRHPARVFGWYAWRRR